MSDENVYVRKMASIQIIDEVKMIPEADKICVYVVQGYNVIDQIGKYHVGDKVIFATIDSFIPDTLCPFLTKPGKFPKTFNGIEGQKLKTKKLLGVYSQGLILPMSIMGDEFYKDRSDRNLDNCWTKPLVNGEVIGANDKINSDVSDYLGIKKWEPPPEFTSADAKGLFPDYIRKTDKERVNSFYKDHKEVFETENFEVTEKCEGSSHTAYFYNGEFGVASRNLNLKRSEENTFWKTALDYDLENKLAALGRNIAIQSELVGPKVSGNIYRLDKFMLFTFDIFDIDKQAYLSPAETQKLIKELGLTSAPVISYNMCLNGKSLEEILEMADGQSVIGTIGCLREGLVFKANSNKRISFKSVSRKYLAKQDAKD